MKNVFLLAVCLLSVHLPVKSIILEHSHDLNPAARQFITALFDEAKIHLNNTQASFKKADKTIDKLAECVSNEQLSKIVTQAGIVLTASTTAVLSAYILYAIAKYEFQKSYERAEKMSWRVLVPLPCGQIPTHC